MRFILAAFSTLIHFLFSPITFALSIGLLLGAWIISRQMRPARSGSADGELAPQEWLGQAPAEWLGA